MLSFQVGIDDPHLILLNFLDFHSNLYKLLLQRSNLLEHFIVLPFKALYPRFKGMSDCNVMGSAGLKYRWVPCVLGELIVLFPIVALLTPVLMQNSLRFFIVHPSQIAWTGGVSFGGGIVVTVGVRGHLVDIGVSAGEGPTRRRKVQTRPVGVSGVFFCYIVAVGVRRDRRTQK